MRKLILLTTCLTLSACISAEELEAAQYAYQSVLQEQCEDVLGFPIGTNQHMQCRMFYENMYKYQTSSYMTMSHVERIRAQIQSMTQLCQSYWGDQDMAQTALWSCIQQKGNDIIAENKRKKELEDQADMLNQAFGNGDSYRNSSRNTYNGYNGSQGILTSILLGN